MASCGAVRPAPPPSAPPTPARPPEGPTPELAADLDRAVAFAERQTEQLYRRLPDLESARDDQYPEVVLFNQKQYRMENAAHWSSGFFPATLWALYELTGSPDWKRRAENKTLGLWGEVVWDYSSNIGYKLFPFREGYRLTGDATFLSFALRGAETYVRSFGAELCIGSIPTWNPGSRRVNGTPLGHPVHTGGLMNIELLFWAAGQPGGQRRWHEVAQRHARNAARDQLREDGAAFHIVDYYPGCPPRGWRWRGTDSGDPNGIKARPHALAMYGFIVAHRYTRDPALLEAALKSARYFLDNPQVRGEGVPFTDLLFPPTARETRESSAAALAASALLDLASSPQVTPDEQRRFRAGAEHLLTALTARYLARGQNEGILGRGGEPLRPGLTPSSSQTIGDFAFLDAIRKYLGPGIHCRAKLCELEAEAGKLGGLRVTAGPPITIENAPARAADRDEPTRAEYQFRLPRAARVRLSIRAQVPISRASLLINLGAGALDWSLARTRGYQVLPGADLDLREGPHTVVLTEIPEGVRLDKLRIERLD